MSDLIASYIITSPEWDLLTDEQRLSCYNGMGPQSFPEFSRDILDFLFDILKDAVMVHDVDFTYGEKKLSRFHRANERFRDNCVRCVKNRIPWWRFWKRRRFLVYWIPLLYKLVESESGWRAFYLGQVREMQII